MADNTVFDSVFKTLVQKAPALVIPFINEAFGRDYPRDEPLVQFNSEHENDAGTTIADSVFKVRNKIYHIECQSTADSNMVVRMIEYDFAIALEETLRAGKPYELNFPESCVLFLRHSERTPDVLEMKVNTPNGGSFTYGVKVVKAQRFTTDEIFQKRLLLLLPYYLMRYEKELASIAHDRVKTAELIAECAAIRNSLELATLGEGEPLLYEELVENITKISDYLLKAHDVLRKKVRAAMGGEILELLHERAERLHLEGIEQGRELGINEGRELGINEGRELGIEEGREAGIAEGRELGIEEGREAGIAEGRELGIAEGRELGIAEGQTSMMIGLVNDGLLDAHTAAIKLGIPDAEFLSLMENRE